MTIKLHFQAHPDFPRPEVWAEDPQFAPVACMLESDYRSLRSTRAFAQDLKDVVAGKIPHIQGAGNGYLVSVYPDESEVGLNVGDDPEMVAVSTVDLIAAVEEWAAHLEALGNR